MRISVRALPAVLVACALVLPGRPVVARQATSDLDQFMAVVLKRRDDNWRKLQQYILDERETADFFAPGKLRLFGMDREYSWFIRDGVFVRSPVKFDGVTLSEGDRKKAEDEWIAQEKDRQKHDAAQAAAARQGAPASASSEGTPTSIDSILKSTREPQFVSAAYFLRFKFEPGHYALVGPETDNGHQVLRIEYYPRRLYDDDGPGHSEVEKEKANEAKEGKGGMEGKGEDIDQRINRQMNKTALVTLWVEPNEHQIVQYRFENLPLDFLPARSMVRVDGFGATMKMGQPFSGVWLPQDIDATGSFTMALGTFDAGYAVRYRNFREANVGMKVHVQ